MRGFFINRKPTSELERALDDFQIIAAQGGDRAAFELLFTRWQPRFLRLSLRLTRNREDAQDVLQDAAISIVKSIGRLDDPRRFSAFCYSIIRRRAADHIARNVKTRAVKTDVSDLPPPAAIDTEGNLAMRQALSRLGEGERLLLTLFYVDGYTGAELAAALGVPMGTVKSRLFTARGHLKQIYVNLENGDFHDIQEN